MSHFGAQPRFERLEEGVARAREGTQTNCAGIAQLTAYVFDEDTRGITVSFEPEGILPLARHQTPGAFIPRELQQAIRDGAQKGYTESAPEGGLEVCIVSAIVHPVDANERVFRACARRLVRRWLEA